MVFIVSEAKWRLYRRSKKKKILALAGAKGRHKNMFSAVFSTTATQLVRIKEDEAKENEQKTPRRSSVSLPSSVPYLGIISGVFYTDIISAAVYSVTVMFVRSCARLPLHLWQLPTTVWRQLANSRVIVIIDIERINIWGRVGGVLIKVVALPVRGVLLLLRLFLAEKKGSECSFLKSTPSRILWKSCI